MGAVADHQGGQEGGGQGEEGGSAVALGEEQVGSRGGGEGEGEEESLRQHQGSPNAHLHPLGPGCELVNGEY